MGDDTDRQKSEAELEREIRHGRKFTPEDAIGRLAGPGAMKGASPVSPQQQAEIAVGTWLRSHVPDPAGALNAVLHRHLKGSGPLMEDPGQPLKVLADYLERLLGSDHLLKEVVREADVEWGRAMDERPHFEREAAAEHPDDPYTLRSVREALEEALKQLVP